ncbi:hypothetical protein Rsub_12799 [Raphidocelis subcapitata]|uniref:Amidohydrolase-related domain-containing protein n=1 Tax=Raphidocelis subcapitata TaxID=307507 RepID=A0A2V0PJT3_9CHLO|nr:hypothetical protein Rsub_12799 [Raphidocelis subcapitata]|eukprot:GBG00055.1 hypothetical protein Rsub_12799 [Raphidocelis subcapitata]
MAGADRISSARISVSRKSAPQSMILSRRGLGLAALGAASQPARSPRAMSHKQIDAHVHVWAPVEESARFPYAGALLGAASSGPEPPLPGYAELLLRDMEAAGVDGALIVQPGNHLYDHRYVQSVITAHPGKFVGCLLADPTPGGGGAGAIRELAATGLFRAVRFNPYLWPEGERMTNKVGREMYATAGELGLPVAHMPFKGLLPLIGDIKTLISDHPQTTVILDHFGFAKCGDLESEEWRELLLLAKHPQVYVKASAFFRVSSEPYPYADAAAALRRLIDAFGARRVMWGTDWPWVTEQCGYAKAWGILDAAAAAGGAEAVSAEERAWLVGGTAAALWPGAWQ